MKAGIALRLIALATAYGIAGWAGVQLAVPPGYATAIFPASGVALAVVLVEGPWLAPGVWLGSFLVNIGIAIAAPGGLDAHSAVTAGFIGVGAMLQALLGAAMIRKWVANVTILDDSRDILTFLALGGPLACLVSPLWGVSTLWLFGVISFAAIPASLGMWWVGDVLGVFITAPIVLALLRWQEDIWQARIRSIVAPTILGSLAITIIFFQVSTWEQSRHQRDFHDIATAITSKIEEKVDGYLTAIASVRRLVSASKGLDRANFAHFSQELLKSISGMQALEWVPRVSHGERDEFEQDMRRQGFADFQINERKAEEIAGAGQRQEYFPVCFIEPLDENAAVVGFDLASNPDRLKALEKSRDTSEQVASGRIPLLQVKDKAKQAGFLVFDPVYGRLRVQRTVTERRRDLAGFVLGVFRIDPIVDVATQAADPRDFFIQIDDTTPDEPATRLYGGDNQSTSLSSFSFTKTLPVAGRVWEIQIKARPAFLARQHTYQAWFVLGGGLLFVSMLQIHLLMVTGGSNRVRRLVEERTTELRREIQERQQIEERLIKLSCAVEQNPASIVITAPNGSIEYVNPNFTNVTGYSLSEVLGKTLNILNSGTHPPEFFAELWQTIYNGRTWKGEIRNRRRNGELYWDDTRISPILSQNNVITSFLAIKMDVSERKTAEEEMKRVNERLTLSVAQLEKRDRERTLLTRMNDLLMACKDSREALQVIDVSLREIFHGLSGALAVQSTDESAMDSVIQWGDAFEVRPTFSLDDCWAVRQGHLHDVDNADTGLVCGHLLRTPLSYVCLPLMVRNNMLGVLTVEVWNGDPSGRDAERLLIMTVGETIKLALSNVMLREALREQAVRDPLTKLYNRRFMEEALAREVARANRHKTPLALAVVDVDFFKKINDTYGHDAGDCVLREVGQLLGRNVRGSDIACRFGGEEFVVIMPETAAESGVRHFNAVREQFKALDIRYAGKPLGRVTMSVGVASLPDHGHEGKGLLVAADTALYAAKQGGRDRVVMADLGEAPEARPE
ncbi:diguanylate cyclase [Roseateles sp.]|uniref:diguanylate cyclase n=1 Tax=Roseateles sp. TaxID=1971397 RepID=UPI002DFB4B4F|nr:diguanylate cyclase [Roseateles sp.]HEV6967761.1 diguanylate cyclase [Roseateles sp.]